MDIIAAERPLAGRLHPCLRVGQGLFIPRLPLAGERIGRLVVNSIVMKTVTGASLIDRFGIDYFREAPVFGALSPAAIEFLLDNGRVLELDRGDVLFEPGDRAEKFFVVLQGALSFYHFHRGQYAFLRDHLFGEEIGYVAMIALHDRIGRAAARQDSRVLEISSGLFYRLHKAMPADFGLFVLNLSRAMARTIREVSNIVVEGAIARGTSEAIE